MHNKIEKKVVKAISNSLNSINESYVSSEKKFKMLTDFLSQKTKESHIKLYKSYLSTFNDVSAKLDSVDYSESDTNHSDHKQLKLDEVHNFNSLWLHELYFANCFDPNSNITMDSLSYMRFQRDFGTFDEWQKSYIACAMSSGNGWAITGWHPYLKTYVNTFVTEHSNNVMLGLQPIVVLDMWEHSYYKDYLNDKKSYIVSQMKEFNWEIIEERIERIEETL